MNDACQRSYADLIKYKPEIAEYPVFLQENPRVLYKVNLPKELDDVLIYDWECNFETSGGVVGKLFVHYWLAEGVSNKYTHAIDLIPQKFVHIKYDGDTASSSAIEILNDSTGAWTGDRRFRVHYASTTAGKVTTAEFAWHKGAKPMYHFYDRDEQSVVEGVTMAILQWVQLSYLGVNNRIQMFTPTTKDAQVNKKRATKNKRPLITISEIELKSVIRPIRELGGTHASPCEHERRGHWRRYKSGKQVWVNSTKVGDPSRGRVTHRYFVQGEQQQ